MANCATGDIPAYVIDSQNCAETGRIVAIAFIKTSKTFSDLSDPSEWTAAITTGDIKVHKKVRGSYPRPSDVEITGKGNQSSNLVGADHQITVRIDNVKGNSNYWNSFAKSNEWKTAFVVGANYDTLFYVDATVSIVGRAIVDESLSSELDWEVVIKWADIDNPEITDVPAGVFTE